MTDRIDDAPLDDGLAGRFERLERIEVPDTWERAVTRSSSSGPRSESSHRWWAAAAAAVLVVGGLATLVATRSDDSPIRDSTTSVASATTERVASSTSPDGLDDPADTAEPPIEDVGTISMPVVEGLAEADAVVTLRDLDLIVRVERVEVEPGDPSAGRVVTQEPEPSALLQPADTATIVIGQATRQVASADALAQTLIDFEMDVQAAPGEASALDGATFCGSERTGTDGFLSDDIDVVGRRCLLDHHAARLPAVFVSEFFSGPESRIVQVTRTRSDGRAVAWIHELLNIDETGRWATVECGALVDVSNSIAPPAAFGCDRVEPMTEPITVDPLTFPAWFDDRTAAPTCGYFTPQIEKRFEREFDQPLACMADAIEDEERAELVTVHVGDEMRVARWIVSIGPSPQGTPQFEVASLVVDLRTGTTRWAETRCVEGFLVDGRLVGDFIVGRGQVDQLDPSGTIVTDSGEVLTQPGADERNQLQPCNGPQRVERPFVTPVEATGQRIGDVGPTSGRFPGSNEVGEYDITIVRSWDPYALADDPAIVGFVPSLDLEFPPPPDSGEPDEPDRTLYADDGVTRVGEIGPDGAAVLD